MKKLLKPLKNVISWIAVDGALHLLVSALGVLALATFLPLWAAALVMVIVGLDKEVCDYIRDRRKVFNWKNSLHDLICDAAGIIVGVIIAVIYLFIR